MRDLFNPSGLKAIVDFFLADPLGLDVSVRRSAVDRQSPIRDQLRDFVAAIDDDDVALVRQDSRLPFDLYDDPRALVAERLIGERVLLRRLVTLVEDSGRSRPRPYDDPALADLELDEHQMVALSQFEFDNARLLRNGLACLPLSTNGAPNSTWWLLSALYDKRLAVRTRVRLDPYLHGPLETFPAARYKMFMYGRRLNWGRIDSLKEAEHGRWMPDTPGHPHPFTDYAWDPRDDEVHFACEGCRRKRASLRRPGTSTPSTPRRPTLSIISMVQSVSTPSSSWSVVGPCMQGTPARLASA